MTATPRATVRHAVIPCIGQVELLPIGGVPMLEWVVRECAGSGTSDLAIVTCSDLDAIRSLIAPRVGAPGFPLSIEFFEGTPSFADALAVGRTFAGASPLGVAIPTHLFVGDAPGLAQVVETYYRTGKNVVGVVGRFATDEVELAPGLDQVVGRYLLAHRDIGTGLDEPALLQALVEANCVVGRRMRGQFLDVTFPEGRDEANRFALR